MDWLRGLYIIPTHNRQLMSLQGEDVTTLDKTWHHFDIFFDTPMIEQAREIGLELPSSWPLHLVAYRSRNPPNYPDEAKPDMLFKYNKIPMQYTDIDLGRASLDTWLKINGSQLSVASYRATVQFRQRVVYLITEPDENTDPDFRRIAVALYKMESADSVYVAPTSTPTYDPYFTGIPQNIPFGECQKLFKPTSHSLGRAKTSTTPATAQSASANILSYHR